jgi:hypothetical protein
MPVLSQRLRRAPPILAAAALLVTGFASAAASDTSASADATALGASCRQGDEHVIANSSEAEVVATVAGRGEYIDVFGCLKSDGVRRTFDTCGCDYIVRALKLRGPKALFRQESFLGEDYSQDLVLVDIRDGKAAIVEGRSLRGRQFGKFGLTHGGTAAYLVRTHGRWTVAACTVACQGQAGPRPRTISAARGIDPDYLRLRGERAYWRQNGRVRSAAVNR